MTVPPGHEGAPSPVPPGTGWPGDPASPATPVARSAAGVARQARSVRTVADLDARVSVCSACPRLVRWREDVARTKRRAFADEPYWGRPVPGWGATRPQVLVVGLAPAAHGANRTGRIFTGDRSGDWLFAALHRAGLAVQPESVHAADGQRLVATRMVAAVRCAPPDNQPTTDERDACAPWLHRELALVSPSVHAIVALGGYGWDALLRTWAAVGGTVPRPRPRFGHGATVVLTTADGRTVTLLGSFHPSQQNTFTGRLTPAMLDDVLIRARAAAGVH